MAYLLTITYPTGRVETLPFPTRFARALVMITLSAQPVTCRLVEAGSRSSGGKIKPAC